MLVTYFFQGEAGESLDAPNAFMLNGNGKATFGQFLQQFPVGADDRMHFRFRADDPENGYVWIDVVDHSATLPMYAGQICAKILKLDPLAINRRKFVLKRKIITAENPLIQKVQSRRTVSNNNPSVPAQAPAKPAKSIPKAPAQERTANGSSSVRVAPPVADRATNQSPFFETDDSLSSYAAPAPVTSSAPAPNIFDDDDDGNIHTGGSQSPKPRTPIVTTSIASASAAMDIDDGISDLQMPGFSRSALAARKEEAIEDKVQAALDFKKEMDQKKEQESQDFDAAREKHERAILAWSTNNKEKRNVRTLLSTMHTVLPSDVKWKSISLGDVLQSAQVKKQYRKAMLVVHQDHTIGLPAESKFICKRVFEAINEAYEEFLKKEGV